MFVWPLILCAPNYVFTISGDAQMRRPNGFWGSCYCVYAGVKMLCQQQCYVYVVLYLTCYFVCNIYSTFSCCRHASDANGTGNETFSSWNSSHIFGHRALEYFSASLKFYTHYFKHTNFDLVPRGTRNAPTRIICTCLHHSTALTLTTYAMHIPMQENANAPLQRDE